jgi:hypothetical protein
MKIHQATVDFHGMAECEPLPLECADRPGIDQVGPATAARPRHSAAGSIYLEHVFAAVGGIAGQRPVARVDDEIQQFQAHLADQNRHVVRDFQNIHGALAIPNGQPDGVVQRRDGPNNAIGANALRTLNIGWNYQVTDAGLTAVAGPGVSSKSCASSLNG